MREPKLEVLSSLCGVLQKAMHGWDDTAPLGDGAQVTERSSSGTQQPFAFAPLLRSVVQEVQTRLIFRAQAFIVSDIQRHNATPEDLDYPSNLGISNSNEDKGAKPSECEPNGQDARKQLRGASSIGGAGVLGAAELDEQGGVRLFQAPPEGVLRTWYPTLRKTLWVLEKLYTHIDVSRPESVPIYIAVSNTQPLALDATSGLPASDIHRSSAGSCDRMSNDTHKRQRANAPGCCKKPCGCTAISYTPPPYTAGNGRQRGPQLKGSCC